MPGKVGRVQTLERLEKAIEVNAIVSGDIQRSTNGYHLSWTQAWVANLEDQTNRQNETRMVGVEEGEWSQVEHRSTVDSDSGPSWAVKLSYALLVMDWLTYPSSRCSSMGSEPSFVEGDLTRKLQ